MYASLSKLSFVDLMLLQDIAVRRNERPVKNPMTVVEARALLKNAKLRSTTSRLAVLEKLSITSNPISHSELADQLVPLGFDKSTIYRVLIELADAKIVSRIDAGDHSWRFELRSEHGGHASGDHPHFVCNDCGKVECLPDVSISLNFNKKKSKAAQPKIDEVFLKGTCGDCND